MTVIGVSVYPDIRPLEEIKEYLRLASKYGVTKVFSSMFSVEGTNEEILDYFRDLIECAHENGMAVSLDVNHSFIRQLGASAQDLKLFHEIGCDILRMDIPYGDDNDLDLCNNPYRIGIEFNASFGAMDHMKDLVNKGVDPKNVTMCHNFYPQRYTGMKWQKFLNINRSIREAGDFRIAAFIASHNQNTHGVWDAKDGLPTVERMRDMSVDLAARVMKACDVDEVLIGNAYASEAEFRALQEVMAPVAVDDNSPAVRLMKMFAGGAEYRMPKTNAVRVKTSPDLSAIEKTVLFDYYPHVDIGDSSEWIWRSRMPRFIYKNETFVPRAFEGEYFQPGDVVMVNDNYKHYASEVQVVLKPVINDGTRNYIGHIADDEMTILELTKDGDGLIFKEDPR